MTVPRFEALCGIGVPADRARRLALRLGLAWRDGGAAGEAPPSDGDGAERRAAALLDARHDAGTAAQPAVWHRPVAAWVDVGALPDDAVAAVLEDAASCDLYASFTTAAANRAPLAARIVAAVAERRPLSEAGRDGMELALHEAIANAVVHGNLEVGTMDGCSAAALERFSAELARRLSDPALAERRVVVRCWLEPQAVVAEVADEGTGYAAATLGHDPDRDRAGPDGSPPSGGGAAGSDRDALAPGGRGLAMIAATVQSYEVLDKGRRIRMRFAS